MKILVVGDTMEDRRLDSEVCRISQEAPIPIYDVNSATSYAGGAANVALNIKAMGGNVTLLTPQPTATVVQMLRDAKLMRVTSKAFAFPQKYNLPFFFVSAADGTNVVKIFEEAVQLAWQYKHSGEKDFMTEVLDMLDDVSVEEGGEGGG